MKSRKTVDNIAKPKGVSLKRSLKLLASCQGKPEKKDRIQTANIRNTKGCITTDSMDIKKIIKEYHEKLNAHKLDNLDETKIP